MKLKGAIAKKGIRGIGASHYESGYHKIPCIWIIIADKHIAKIFSKAGDSLEMIGEAFSSGNEENETEKREAMI